MALNFVALLGRITKDLELKSTQNGTSVLQFTVAVDRDFVKQGEERQTDFISCVAFKQTAEFISKFFGKGRMIAVEGRLQTRSYDDKNGTKHNVTEVIVNKASFTGEKAEQRQEQKQDALELGGYDDGVLSDEAIPF